MIKKIIKLILPKQIIQYLKLIKNKIMSLEITKIYNTKTGRYCLPLFSFQDIIKKQIINDKVWGEFVYNTSKDYIEENSIVIDAGANFGQLSVLFSKLKKNVTVYSFESSKFIFELLKKNAKLNNANIIPVHCVLGDISNKFYKIQKSDLTEFNSWGSNRVKILKNNISNIKSENVKAIKIDDFNFKKKISFLKIDVQGYDLKVLIGSKKTIMKHRMPIMFEYEVDFEKYFNYNFDSFEKFIKEINYKISKNFDNKNFLILPK